VRQNAKQINSMSDEQLQRQIDMSRSFMPGMPPMTPQMMRNMYKQMDTMPDEQINTAINMQKQKLNGTPSSNT